MNDHALEKKSGGWSSYLDGSSDGFRELLPDMSMWGPNPSFVTELT